VRITKPAPADLVPYRDYLGSNLEILDVSSGNATIVHRYPGSFQAPNWTRDGKALIYAQEGRLYRFDLASREAAAVNTGFATRNNNDHVLSFDGRMLAISNHLPEDSGAASIVYTVPATGGTPKRITARGPSYLPRWSLADIRRSTQRRVRHLQDSGGRRRRDSADPVAGPRRRPGVRARRQVRLFLLGAQRSDADLAHAARWHRAGAGHQRRVPQLVSAHLTRRQVDRVHLVSAVGGGRERSSLLQARPPAIDADRGRSRARDCVRVWRAGNDQRAVLVPGLETARVRQQHSRTLSHACRCHPRHQSYVGGLRAHASRA